MTQPHKSPFRESGTIAAINFKLGYSVFLIAVGIWIWPSDPRWYAFYGMSVICCAAAMGLIFNALRTMRQLQLSHRQWREIQAKGKAPKNARLATMRDLRAKGMK